MSQVIMLISHLQQYIEANITTTILAKLRASPWTAVVFALSL
jgi:hypothetical protein